MGKPEEFSEDGIHKVIMSENSDVMSDEEFEKMIDNEDVPMYDDLSEEELLARQKEFVMLSKKAKSAFTSYLYFSS